MSILSASDSNAAPLLSRASSGRKPGGRSVAPEPATSLSDGGAGEEAGEELLAAGNEGLTLAAINAHR